jgi:membrane-associated phospholipid phosphatase
VPASASAISGRDWLRRILPGLLIATYGISLWRYAPGGLKTFQLISGAALLSFADGGARWAVVTRFCLPFVLTAVLYDSQRYYGDLLRGRIRVSELYLLEHRLFGIQGQTPNEWWQQHTYAALDLITGAFYLGFIAFYVALALGWYLRRRENAPAWSFIWVNLLGYSTYYWYPAAPPWYVALYGLGPARLEVQSNPAGCARFDRLLGTHFFDGMYGMSADVFGSVPSLHVSYPVMAIFFAFRYGRYRGLAVTYYLGMAFSAVYLNHHYLIDVLWGAAYGVFVAWAVDRLMTPDRRFART